METQPPVCDTPNRTVYDLVPKDQWRVINMYSAMHIKDFFMGLSDRDLNLLDEDDIAQVFESRMDQFYARLIIRKYLTKYMRNSVQGGRQWSTSFN